MKIRSLLMILSFICLVLVGIVVNPPKPAHATPTISNDTVNKKVTITCTRYSLIMDYNSKAIITSFKVDSKEMLDQGTNNGIYSAVMIGGNWVTTQGSVTPSVSVSGSVVTLTLSTSVASETWTLTAADSNVQYKLSRTYNAAYTVQQQGSPMLNFKQDIIENIRWLSSGSNYWVGGQASALKKFLAAGTGYSATDNIRRGMEDIQYTLISSAADNFALKVTGTTNRDSLSRGRATEMEREDTGSTKFLRFYTVLANPTTNLTYATGSQSPHPDGWTSDVWTSGHVRAQGSNVYGNVSVANGENVQVTLTLTPDVYDNYYNLGTLNGVNWANCKCPIPIPLSDISKCILLSDLNPLMMILPPSSNSSNP